MKYIDVDIQGFMRRRGFRGRWVTVYWHTYSGHMEKTERYHSHPWRRAISIILKGGFMDDRICYAGKDKFCRKAPSLSTYSWMDQHRIMWAEAGTVSLFIGINRNPFPSKNATEKTKEGYCHYSELRDVPRDDCH